jgi:hypothetical protein
LKIAFGSNLPRQFRRMKLLPCPAPASGSGRPFPVNSPIDKIGTGCGFAASNARETGKKAEMRCDMADFCGIRDIVCATQSAPTRVS